MALPSPVRFSGSATRVASTGAATPTMTTRPGVAGLGRSSSDTRLT